jgi:hypothetical protein
MSNKFRASLVPDISLPCSYDTITTPCPHSARPTQHPHTKLSFSQLSSHPHFSTSSCRSSFISLRYFHILSCRPCYLIVIYSIYVIFLKRVTTFDTHTRQQAELYLGYRSEGHCVPNDSCENFRKLHSVFLTSTFSN